MYIYNVFSCENVCIYMRIHVYTYLDVEQEGLGFMSYLSYTGVCIGPRADMYLLSLSTLTWGLGLRA
jgi:hypothetical protein